MEISLDPRPSSLPFKLKGTIIHTNPIRSVATISSGSENKTLSYQKGEVIEKQARIEEINRGRVVFINQNNSRLEYIEIPKEEKEVFKINPSFPEQKSYSIVKRKGENRFQVKRSDVNRYLQQLPSILQEATVIPYRSREGGAIEGFRFVHIDKGSVFEDLGFEKQDIIKKVDGETVMSIDQALELFEKLKGSSGFTVIMEKKGKEISREYSVNEDAPMI